MLVIARLSIRRREPTHSPAILSIMARILVSTWLLGRLLYMQISACQEVWHVRFDESAWIRLAGALAVGLARATEVRRRSRGERFNSAAVAWNRRAARGWSRVGRRY